MGKKPRLPKDPDVLNKIRTAASRGEYIPVYHAKLRMGQREVTDPEVRYVLLRGYREVKKDEFKLEYRSWNYAIRGRTVDERVLRIVVSFDPKGMLLVTVIDLEKKHE